jgi:hypothetical protein
MAYIPALRSITHACQVLGLGANGKAAGFRRSKAFWQTTALHFRLRGEFQNQLGYF